MLVDKDLRTEVMMREAVFAVRCGDWRKLWWDEEEEIAVLDLENRETE